MFIYNIYIFLFLSLAQNWIEFLYICYIYIFLFLSLAQNWVEVLYSWCLTVYDAVDSSLPDSSVYGISQVRILEWLAISYSRGSSWPRDQNCISTSYIGRQILYHWYYLGNGKEFICQCKRHKRHRFSLWIRKVLWRRARQANQYSCQENPHGQRSLVGYSP